MKKQSITQISTQLETLKTQITSIQKQINEFIEKQDEYSELDKQQLSRENIQKKVDCIFSKIENTTIRKIIMEEDLMQIREQIKIIIDNLKNEKEYENVIENEKNEIIQFLIQSEKKRIENIIVFHPSMIEQLLNEFHEKEEKIKHMFDDANDSKRFAKFDELKQLESENKENQMESYEEDDEFEIEDFEMNGNQQQNYLHLEMNNLLQNNNNMNSINTLNNGNQMKQIQSNKTQPNYQTYQPQLHMNLNTVNNTNTSNTNNITNNNQLNTQHIKEYGKDQSIEIVLKELNSNNHNNANKINDDSFLNEKETLKRQKQFDSNQQPISNNLSLPNKSINFNNEPNQMNQNNSTNPNNTINTVSLNNINETNANSNKQLREEIQQIIPLSMWKLIEQELSSQPIEILFDSEKDNWSIGKSVFFFSIFKQSNMIILVMDSDKEYFGCYIPNEFETSGKTKSTYAYLFNFIFRNNRLQVSFNEEKSMAYIPEVENEVLFSVGNEKELIVKKCGIGMSSRLSEDEIVEFTPKRIVAIKMEITHLSKKVMM